MTIFLNKIKVSLGSLNTSHNILRRKYYYEKICDFAKQINCIAVINHKNIPKGKIYSTRKD